MTIVAFDRTYEGLKRGRLGPKLKRGATFDRTYEGLKPEEVGDLLLQAPLLTVPMRV